MLRDPLLALVDRAQRLARLAQGRNVVVQSVEGLALRLREHVQGEGKPESIWMRVIYITEEFSFTDRCLAIGLLVWNLIWVVLFAGASIYTWLLSAEGFSTEAWARFWKIWVYIQLAIGIPVTIWFTVGGITDISKALRRLKTLQRDETDDGSVITPEAAGEETQS